MAPRRESWELLMTPTGHLSFLVPFSSPFLFLLLVFSFLSPYHLLPDQNMDARGHCCSGLQLEQHCPCHLRATTPSEVTSVLNQCVNCQVLDGMTCAVRFRDISLLVMQLGFSHDSSVMNII